MNRMAWRKKAATLVFYFNISHCIIATPGPIMSMMMTTMVTHLSPRLTFTAAYTYPECSNHDGYERACTDATDVVKHIMDWPLTDPLQLFH